MDYFIWTAGLSLDIPQIDEEHKKWIGYLNQLHHGLEEERGKEVLEKLLDDVISFSKYHFEHEEALFDQANYPDANFHKELHRDFINRLEEIKTRLVADDADSLTLSVMYSLKNWLIAHVQEVDKQYVPYVVKQKQEDAND